MVSIVTGAIGLLAAALILFLVRRDRLQAGQAVRWIIVALGFSLLGFAPGATDQLARMLGISYPPVLALSLGIVVLVVKILIMDIERSRQIVGHERLVQRMAILEAAVDQTKTDIPNAAGDADT
jgi:hypothetical protein